MPMERLKQASTAFAQSSALPHATLLQLIEKWRRLQSGASDKKAPAYSTES